MEFDFSSITTGNNLRSILDPVALFDALPNKEPGLGYLRRVQADVLENWSSSRNETDLVIKMNTGTGKTIVGLLILQVSLHDGAGPALYLAPDPHLADRVEQEARRLGLNVTDNPSNTKFRSCESICVTSLQRLINGKSVFKLSGNPNIINIGSIVIDDAHSGITRLEEVCRALIPPDDPVYPDLLALFEKDLQGQSAATLMDIKSGDRGPVMRIPFWAWQDKVNKVLAILQPLRRTRLEWTWPLVSDHLALCEATLSSEGIEISPPLPPIQRFPSFVDARRRVYMTATLANDSALITHFRADPASVSNPIVPASAADLGDRLVLVPQELLPGLSDDELREAIAGIAVTDNVVVLAPSWARANLWRDVANEVVSTSEEITAVTERLKSGAVGLVVIVNRYDGIDLPDGACRVLVLDGLPQATHGAERREASALRDSNAIVTRQVQRFEQGMGRAVRSREDRCAVLIMDRRLVELISRADVPPRLSPGTRAQLALSRTVADSLEGRRDLTMDGLVDLVRKVIDGAEDFKSAARQALVDVKYEKAEPDPTAPLLRKAYDAAVRGDLETAARNADAASNEARDSLHDERLAGWLMEKAAAYWNPIDPAMAQRILVSASVSNASTLHPIAGVAFRPMRPTRRQAQAAIEYLSSRYSSGEALRIGVEALLADLDWMPDRTEEAEQALSDLAGHLGFAGQRPEKETGQGGDVLWNLGDNNYLAIEAKTGAVTDFIAKKDIDQLGGFTRWVHDNLLPSGTVVPVLVHPSRLLHHTGTAPEGTRVIDREHLTKLAAAIRNYTNALVIDDRFRSDSAVQEQLTQFGLNGLQFHTRYGAVVQKLT
jgi:hypothetical protein